MFRSQASSSCYNLWVLDPRTQKLFKHLKQLVELHMLFEFSDTLNPLSQNTRQIKCMQLHASQSFNNNKQHQQQLLNNLGYSWNTDSHIL